MKKRRLELKQAKFFLMLFLFFLLSFYKIEKIAQASLADCMIAAVEMKLGQQLEFNSDQYTSASQWLDSLNFDRFVERENRIVTQGFSSPAQREMDRQHGIFFASVKGFQDLDKQLQTLSVQNNQFSRQYPSFNKTLNQAREILAHSKNPEIELNRLLSEAERTGGETAKTAAQNAIKNAEKESKIRRLTQDLTSQLIKRAREHLRSEDKYVDDLVAKKIQQIAHKEASNKGFLFNSDEYHQEVERIQNFLTRVYSDGFVNQRHEKTHIDFLRGLQGLEKENQQLSSAPEEISRFLRKKGNMIQAWLLMHIKVMDRGTYGTQGLENMNQYLNRALRYIDNPGYLRTPGNN